METTIELIHDAVASNLSKMPEKAKEIETVYKPRIDWHQKKISEKVDNSLLNPIFYYKKKNYEYYTKLIKNFCRTNKLKIF